MTEYHKIYKFMRDNIWASIEVFNNVHPRLGGLHTIMNSSRSVGNRWWCRQNAIPDLIKHCKTKLLFPLHKVLCQCWQEGAVPRDTRDSKIITIYKNKGEQLYTMITTTGASPYAALSAKYLIGSYWYASRSWRSVSTQSHNVASVLNGQQ